MKRSIHYLIALLIFTSCSNGEKIVYDLSNPDIQKIIDFQDKRDTKALIPYFVHDSKELRERACLAFASIQDSSALESLYTMLEEDEKTARAAALAVGQVGNSSSVPKLKKVMERSMNEETRYEFFVALGKCGSIDENYFLASNYNVGKDARGTAWALFYLARNKRINEAGIELAIRILQNEKEQAVRLGAAQAIMRNQLDKPVESILDIFLLEENDEVKMALAGSLTGIDESMIDEDLLRHINSCSPNCQINFLKSVKGLYSNLLMEYGSDIILNEENINLQIEAASYMKDFPDLNNTFLAKNDLNKINWRVRNLLFESVLSIENEAIYNLCEAYYEETDNLYEKGQLLGLLGSLPGKKDWLIAEINRFDSIVPTYGMDALATILENEDDEMRKSNTSFLINNLSAKSNAVITYSAFILRDSVYISENIIEQLKEKQALLSMPLQNEAYIEIGNTINFLSGSEDVKSYAEYNHPIALDSLEYLSTIKGFKVQTTKGVIFMKTNAWEAPGTVLSLAKLVDQGYYNGKLYHRVVPNFVIQTGCPYGDGWGGMNYTIRSEFTQLQYSTGAVGMASAGKDTESCQWFVSHSPTPHLNGRYTIFAYVTEGMDIVQNIEVGDRIIAMDIVYN